MKPMRPTEGWPPHRCGEPEIATVYPYDPFERAGGADIGPKTPRADSGVGDGRTSNEPAGTPGNRNLNYRDCDEPHGGGGDDQGDGTVVLAMAAEPRPLGETR